MIEEPAKPDERVIVRPRAGRDFAGVEIRLTCAETGLKQVDVRLGVVEAKLSSLYDCLIRIERAVGRLQDNARDDFRLTFGALIATALSFAGMMAKGFHWV